jgi:hypothetical protein
LKGQDRKGQGGVNNNNSKEDIATKSDRSLGFDTFDEEYHDDLGQG